VPEVVLTQAFDAAGNRTSLAAQIGNTADFLSACTYDDLGRMTRVEQSGQTGGNSVAPKRVDFAYDAASRFDTITRYANLAGTQLVAQTDYTYDDASRLTALTHSKGQTTLAGYSWSYDDKGRLTEYDSTIDGTADYTYDDTDQLVGADYSYQTDETYSYDANGNRTNTGYDTDPNNRLASDGVYNYEYDDEGNRTKRTNISSGAVTEYTWDYRNRLTKVLERASTQGPATKVTEYSYDVFDRRVGKDVDDDGDQDVDRGERYVYDGRFLPSPAAGRGAGGEGACENIVLQFDGDDNVTHRYLFGPAVDQVLADEDASGDVLWSLTDHQGTVRDLAEYDSGQDTTTVVNHIKYDAFGNITGQSNSSLTPHFAYTGREWDPDSGLYYYRARWYDPKTGRFLSEDPVGFAAGDANLQRYVNNGPTFATDPTGCSGGGSGGGGANNGIERKAPIRLVVYVYAPELDPSYKGHVWVELADDNYHQTTGPVGFRPAKRISALNPGEGQRYTGPGIFSAERYDADWTVKMVFRLTREQYMSALAVTGRLRRNPGIWSKDRNCATVAIEIANAASVKLPDAMGLSSFISGPNPGSLGKNMVNTTSVDGRWVIKKGSGDGGGSSQGTSPCY
jgi:RHS repeat-associated protein